MLTGYENVKTVTLAKAYFESKSGPQSEKAEKVRETMEQEFLRRRVSLNHPAFSRFKITA